MKFCWVTLHVRDMEKSLQFYRDTLGLEVARLMKPSPDRALVFLGKGETQVELIWNEGKEIAPYGPDFSIGFEVDKLEPMIEKLGKSGIPVCSGPHQPTPFIRFFYVLDPDGMKVQFVENVR